MTSSVRTKARQKQPTFTASLPISADVRRLEQAVMALEDAVYSVIDMNKGHAFHDVDFLYWNRKLKNIAMQVSLALDEYRGPRQFHQHYRHDPRNQDALYPVAGPSPMITLARVAREALTDCADMAGITDRVALKVRERLEQSLRVFLHRYRAHHEQTETA